MFSKGNIFSNFAKAEIKFYKLNLIFVVAKAKIKFYTQYFFHILPVLPQQFCESTRKSTFRPNPTGKPKPQSYIIKHQEIWR